MNARRWFDSINWVEPAVPPPPGPHKMTENEVKFTREILSHLQKILDRRDERLRKQRAE